MCVSHHIHFCIHFLHQVCGKLCGAAALEGNDTIFLGNIDKNWKKEDV